MNEIDWNVKIIFIHFIYNFEKCNHSTLEFTLDESEGKSYNMTEEFYRSI